MNWGKGGVVIFLEACVERRRKKLGKDRGFGEKEELSKERGENFWN